MAGASAADVRSILSLPAPSTPGPSQPKKAAASAKKPEGISRELYSLIGSSAPTLAAQLAKPRLKQKPNLGGGGKVRWQWREFKNGARNDGLKLSHWAKASTDPDADYPFAKYNVQNVVYTYSQDEYTRVLEDPEWTKEETDYLFDMVREFDSRFYIVTDRYDYPNGTPRSMEDLKDRYYSVCRKLIRNRPWGGDEASRMQLMSSFQFDKEREVTRKKYLTSLESRTPEQIAEEEALYIELKKLEQTERRFRRERDELLRTLLGADSGLSDLAIDEEGPAATSDPRKKKKGPVGMDIDSPVTPSSAVVLPKRAQSAKSAAYAHRHALRKRNHHQILTPSRLPALLPHRLPQGRGAAKVSAVVQELGLRMDRVVMPTRDVLAQHEMLIEAAAALVETKKVVDRVEQDIRVARERLGLRESEAPGEGASTSVGEGMPSGAGTPMDVDEEVASGALRVGGEWAGAERDEYPEYEEQESERAAVDVGILRGYQCNINNSSWHEAAKTLLKTIPSICLVFS